MDYYVCYLVEISTSHITSVLWLLEPLEEICGPHFRACDMALTGEVIPNLDGLLKAMGRMRPQLYGCTDVSFLNSVIAFSLSLLEVRYA